jgi:hypothetical protein
MIIKIKELAEKQTGIIETQTEVTKEVVMELLNQLEVLPKG